MELAKHETCFEYFRRRLSEGWKCVSLEGYNAVLLSPEGIIRELDLRNDVETLRPNASGDETSINTQYPASTYHWDKVDEVSADDGGTYVQTAYSSGVWERDLYNLPAHSGSGIINKVTVYVRGYVQSGGFGTQSISVKTHDTVYDYEQAWPDAWGVVSHELTTNPNTDAAWTWEEIDALQAGPRMRGWNSPNKRAFTTQVYVEVDYTLAALQTILPSAIASLEAFGTARLNLKLFPSAIASLEAFGSPTVILVGNYIYPTGIASQEAFGNPTVLPGAVIIQPSAIQSAEALGSPQLNLKLFAQGIPSAETFGTPLVIPGAVIIQPSGIASLEAFGTPLVFYDQVIIPTGIASAEAFGTPTISFILLIKPKSIPSAEAFGTLKVLREIIHIILDGQYTQGSPGVNRVYIIGKDAEGNPVYGTSLNQAEIDLVGERLDFTQDLSIPTTAKAADVAAAAVAKARLTGARGFIVIPPNCGQELWDVIQVTDKPTAQSQQKYRVIAVSFDYEPLRHRYQHKLILGAP